MSRLFASKFCTREKNHGILQQQIHSKCIRFELKNNNKKTPLEFITLFQQRFNRFPISIAHFNLFIGRKKTVTYLIFTVTFTEWFAVNAFHQKTKKFQCVKIRFRLILFFFCCCCFSMCWTSFTDPQCFHVIQSCCCFCSFVTACWLHVVFFFSCRRKKNFWFVWLCHPGWICDDNENFGVTLRVFFSFTVFLFKIQLMGVLSAFLQFAWQNSVNFFCRSQPI